MRKQIESILLAVCAALVGMLLLQFIPANLDYVVASAPRQAQVPAGAARYESSASVSGLRAEVLEFGDGGQGTLTVVRDSKGVPLARIDGAVPVGWSPVQDMLLLRKVGAGGGFLLRDLSAYTGWNKLAVANDTSPAFGKAESLRGQSGLAPAGAGAAVFSKDGRYILLEGKDGIARPLSVVELLQPRQNTLTAAAWNENESGLPDLPFDR